MHLLRPFTRPNLLAVMIDCEVFGKLMCDIREVCRKILSWSSYQCMPIWLQWYPLTMYVRQSAGLRSQCRPSSDNTCTLTRLRLGSEAWAVRGKSRSPHRSASDRVELVTMSSVLYLESANCNEDVGLTFVCNEDPYL
jgi:hypothetical protein